MDTRTFAGKFLSRLDKIDRQQIESYLSNLIQEKNFLEIIFNRMLEGIIVTDTDLRIMFMNSAACRALNLKDEPDIFAGKHLVELIHNDRLRNIISNFDPTEGERFSEELALKKPKRKVLQIGFLPVENEEGEVESSVFLISDVTEEKKSEYMKHQKRRIQALATLTAGVAHEIKNPLNSLQIHAQLLKKFLQTPEDKITFEQKERSVKSINVILEEIARLSEIVNQFLMTVTPRKPELKPGDLNHVIKKVLETIQPEIEKNGIDLKIQLEPAKTECLINEKRLVQAILNILKNALEALEETPEPRIRIITSIKGSFMKIDIIDNGCGIPGENMEKIFEPYFSTKFSGSGLGLMMVYRIVNEHDGDINIESEPGSGTKATITIPLSRRPIRYLTEKAGEK